MLGLGPHGGFIVLAYGATALVLVLLVAWIVSDLRAQRALLAELEARKARTTASGKARPRARAAAPRKRAKGRKR